jgi:hypothetical protein
MPLVDGRYRLWIAAVAAAALTPLAAAAQDAPVATGRTEAPPSATADDLLSQLDAIPNRADAYGDVPPPFTEAHRRVHGEMSVGIGTGGYRQMGGSVVIPVGRTGTVGIAVDISEGGRRHYPGYGHYYPGGGYYPGYGYGY